MIKVEPFICCLCPTYKRAEMLANVTACFLTQTYEDKLLLICDDAGQFTEQMWEDQVVGTPDPGFDLYIRPRFPNLPKKFDFLANCALGHDADILAIWEDDDVYLPDHLTQIAEVWKRAEEPYRNKLFITPHHIWSTYNENHQGAHIENAAGRFHASWSFTSRLYKHVCGYPDTDELIYDQMMGAKLTRGGLHHTLDGDHKAQYVYRWGNINSYHGSAAGDVGYKQLWNELSNRPAPFVGKLVPRFDEETVRLYQQILGIDCRSKWPHLA